MSTPNIEELDAQLSYYYGDGDQVDMARQAQRLAANALQSQAERIAELERESETHSKAYGLAIVERDNLRHEVNRAYLDCVDYYNAALDEINELGQQLKVAQEGWRCECSTDDACRFARERDAKAEHIKELEADFSRLEATAQKFCVRNTFVEAENDTLRTQLATIAATEPVAYRWVWKSKPHDIEGWCYTSTPPNSPELQEIEKLFTRPMPAEDVTEFVEALEEYGRAGVGNSTDWRVQLSALRLASTALSKYKGAK